MTDCNRELDCRTAVQQLWDYLDHELTPERMAEVRRHLERCGQCLPHHD
ncbi:MAG: putative zinc-finger, partial [Geminicoccaceae bacterium]|nr:putative zinc-finger [Geminicoccaceae bacterium]